MIRAVMDAYRRALAKAACKVARLRHGEDGQGTTEYAILVGVLVVIAIIAITVFRPKLQELWDAIARPASTACRRIAARDCAGQATVEFALVAVAFLSVVLGMGALWRSVSAGTFVEHALSCASHCVTGSLPGALADTVLY